MIYLDETDVMTIAARVLDAPPVLRDPGLLAMSLARPATVAFGVEPYDTVGRKAAALLVALTMNRSFVDGDKRVALAAAWAFCHLNTGRMPALGNDAAHDLVMAVARGDIDVPDVAAALWEGGIA